MPILVRIAPFLPRGCPRGIYAGLARLSAGCPPDKGRLHTCYSPVRHSPAVRASSHPAAVRLACVKPAASVHPEPGSNSPLLVYHSFLFFYFVWRLLMTPVCCLLAGYPLSSIGFPDDFRLTETSFSVSPCLCLYGPGPRPVQVICPVALLSMFSLCPRSLRRGFVPVCGCKITTVFLPPQVFLCFTASFSEILSAKSFQSIESTNVKICFAMLITKLLPPFSRYHLCLLSRIHAEKPTFFMFLR